MDEKNKLYFGDNLKILRDRVEDASVDLIYLDPPFDSSATYSFGVAPPFRAAHAGLKPSATSGRAGRPPFNSSATYSFGVALPFRAAHAGLKPSATAAGEESAAQIMAFEDTCQWGRESEAVYREIVESGPRKLADLVQAKANGAHCQKGEPCSTVRP
jgi:site-specific DNA-methyltransferase (adenine-specific)